MSANDPKADMYPYSIRRSVFWPEQMLAFRWRRLVYIQRRRPRMLLVDACPKLDAIFNRLRTVALPAKFLTTSIAGGTCWPGR